MDKGICITGNWVGFLITSKFRDFCMHGYWIWVNGFVNMNWLEKLTDKENSKPEGDMWIRIQLWIRIRIN